MADDGATGSKRKFSKLDSVSIPDTPADVDGNDGALGESPDRNRCDAKDNITPEDSGDENYQKGATETARKETIKEIEGKMLPTDKQLRFLTHEWLSDFYDPARAGQMTPVQPCNENSPNAVAMSQESWDLLASWYGVSDLVTVRFTSVGTSLPALPDQEARISMLLGDLVHVEGSYELWAAATTKQVITKLAFTRLNARTLRPDMTVLEADLGSSERVIVSTDPKFASGTTGLNNLGNSCYMNSSLQCLTHIGEIVQYFLSGAYEQDINDKNPIGYGGHVATAFGKLVASMYGNSVPSFSPYAFKSTVGRYNRAFAGHLQQDSQEFTAFLLDGLHEDLNKVRDKPATEKPELPQDKVHDAQAIADLAEQCWELHKKRNDSVIQDLFTGMYKSTLVCPVCSAVSITFDPFGDLTLPLPSSSQWFHQVTVMPLAGAKLTLEIALTPLSTIKQLKEQVHELTALVGDNIEIAEVFNGRLFAIYHDDDIVGDKIGPSDVVIALETAEPTDAHFPVLVYCRYTPPSGSACFGSPFMLVVSPDDNGEEIRRKVVERLVSLVEPGTALNFSLAVYPGEDSDTALEHYFDTSRIQNLDLAASEEKEAESQLTDADQDDQSDSSVSVLSGPISSPSRTYSNQEVESVGAATKQSHYHMGRYDLLFLNFERTDVPQFVATTRVENPIATRARERAREKPTFSLLDCLDQFSKPEVLGESDLWYCANCKEFRQATKQMELWSVGDIFTVHLKRFSDFQSFRDKISDVVEFPIEGLDLSSWVAGPHKKSLVYDLIGVDNHYGGLGGGHYTSYAKNPVDQQWYYYDDSRVTPTEPEKAITGAAYLLFYRLRSEQPLGNFPSFRLQDVIEEAKKQTSESHESQNAAPASDNGELKERFPGHGRVLGSAQGPVETTQDISHNASDHAALNGEDAHNSDSLSATDEPVWSMKD